MVSVWLNLIRKCHTILQSGGITLHSHQQCIEFQMLHILGSTLYWHDCFSLLPRPPSYRYIVWSHCGFILHFLSDWALLFVYLLAICIYSWMKCFISLLLIFLKWVVWFSFFFLLNFKSFFYTFWISTFHQMCILQTLSPSLWFDFLFV